MQKLIAQIEGNLDPLPMEQTRSEEVEDRTIEELVHYATTGEEPRWISEGRTQYADKKPH